LQVTADIDACPQHAQEDRHREQEAGRRVELGRVRIATQQALRATAANGAISAMIIARA
jgi:hypothetical protein